MGFILDICRDNCAVLMLQVISSFQNVGLTDSAIMLQ